MTIILDRVVHEIIYIIKGHIHLACVAECLLCVRNQKNCSALHEQHCYFSWVLSTDEYGGIAEDMEKQTIS